MSREETVRMTPGVKFMMGSLAVILMTAAFACKPERPAATTREKPVDDKEWDRRIVATIGDREITVDEIRARLDAMPVFVRMRYRTEERRREFLESYVQYQVLALEAQRAGYGTDPEVVDALKSDMVGRFLRERVDSRIQTTRISDEQVRQYYRVHQHRFHRPAQFGVSHVLVNDEVQAAKVLFRAKKLCNRPGADPREEFGKLVQKYSEDESTLNAGGDIGFFPRVGSDPREIPPKVEEAAGGLTALFEMSDLVRSEHGYHILFVSSRRPAVDKSVDVARTEIVTALMDQERDSLRKEFIEGLMKEATVTINEEEVRRVIEESLEKENR